MIITVAVWEYWQIRRWLAEHDPEYLHEMDAAE